MCHTVATRDPLNMALSLINNRNYKGAAKNLKRVTKRALLKVRKAKLANNRYMLLCRHNKELSKQQWSKILEIL
jgi:hypothetical protein